jgi:hypothetical protein
VGIHLAGPAGIEPTSLRSKRSILSVERRTVIGGESRNRTWFLCSSGIRWNDHTSSLSEFMVLLTGNDPVSQPYQGSVMPLYYRSLGCLTGIDPVLSLSQSNVQATTLKTPLFGPPHRIRTCNITFVALYSRQMS